MAWYSDLRGFYGNEMILVVGVSMRMLVTGGNECTNARQKYKNSLPSNYIIHRITLVLFYVTSLIAI